jgi:putative flippase GtrA
MDHKKTNPLIQFIAFNVIGMVNTLLAMAIYFLIIYMGGHYAFALIADYTFGICFSFFMNKHFTFRIQTKATLNMFSKMVLSYGLLFVGNLGILTFSVEVLEINVYLAQVLSWSGLMVISFFLQKMFVFHVAHV